MTKRINTPEPTETVTIPKSSFDNMFRMMEKMAKEIADLKDIVAEKVKPKDRVLSVNEAAEYCGVARQTISRWNREKRIHKVQRGCKVGYLESELDLAKEV